MTLTDNPYQLPVSPHYKLVESVIAPHPYMFGNVWRGLVIPTAQPQHGLFFSINLTELRSYGPSSDRNRMAVIREADEFIIKELREKGWINEQPEEESTGSVFSL
jgi:hypothetical protein